MTEHMTPSPLKTATEDYRAALMELSIAAERAARALDYPDSREIMEQFYEAARRMSTAKETYYNVSDEVLGIAAE